MKIILIILALTVAGFAQTTKDLVLIGDSIAEGHQSVHGRLHCGGAVNYDPATCPSVAGMTTYYITQNVPGINGINQGIGSQTCANVRTRWGRDVLKDGSNPGDLIGVTGTLTQKPFAVWIHCGINDVTLSRTAAQIEADIDFMVASALSNGLRVIIDTIGNGTNYASSGDAAYVEITAVNSYINSTYGSKYNVKVLDYWTWAKDPTTSYHTNADGRLGGDNLHPTISGYSAWETSVQSTVQIFVNPHTTLSLGSFTTGSPK